jgi:hypothetical protein
MRVLVGNCSRMLGEIIARTIGQQADMEVIWNSIGKSEITPAHIAMLQVDVLVMTADGDTRPAASGYLEARPGLRVISASEDGRTALHYYTTSRNTTNREIAGPESTEISRASTIIIEESLAELDANRLVQAIRGVQHAG